jgi:hypothetical protein
MSRNLTSDELSSILDLIPPTEQGQTLRQELTKRLEGRRFETSTIPRIVAQAKRVAQSLETLEPRPLTPLEIEDIVKALPKVKSADKEAGEMATEEIRDKVRRQLQGIKITPLGIPMLTEELINKFSLSRIAPGSTIGVNAAEAFGAQITQMTLNTFHSAGSSKNVSAGVGRIKEIIRATTNPKFRSCSVFFKNRSLSLEDLIRDVRPEIVGLKIADLLLDYELDNRSSLMEEEPFWYKLYRSLIRSDFGQYDTFLLRIYLSTDLLYAYKLDMAEIAAKIEEGGGVIAVYSPLNLGLIDIYATPEIARESGQLNDPDQATIVFLQTIVLPRIGPIRLTGIEGIDGLFPVSLPVMSVVSSETDLGDDTWLLKYNLTRLHSSGIGKDSLIKLVKEVGLEVVPSDEYDSVGLVVKSTESPISLIGRKIAEDDKETSAWEDSERKKGILFPQRPPTALARAAKFYYADTIGSNYKLLLSREDIDARYTTSNDVHEILDALGIEAARNFLILELLRVITAEGSYINTRHVGIVAEFMTNQGRVVPITYFGIQRQPIGALALASFERAMTVFSSAASYNKVENILSTSTSIYVGKRAPIGTGYVDIIPTQASREETKQIPKPSPQELSRAIEQLDNVILGENIVDSSIDMEEMLARTAPVMYTPTKERQGTKIISLGRPSPPQIAPLPVVSDQLIEVRQQQTTLPCLPKVEEVTINRQLPGPSTSEVQNRNLHPIPTLQTLPTQGFIKPISNGRPPSAPSRPIARGGLSSSRSITPKRR